MIELEIRGTDCEKIKEMVLALKRDGFQETFRWGPASGGWLRVVLVRPGKAGKERREK